MPKIEYGDLYKFITSIGIALVLASIILPWVYLREDFHLLVSISDLGGLTPNAKDTIEDQQIFTEWILRVLPYLCILLFLSGIGLTIWGIKRWFAQQEFVDQKVVADLEKTHLENLIHQMTMEEVREKATMELPAAQSRSATTTSDASPESDETADIDLNTSEMPKAPLNDGPPVQPTKVTLPQSATSEPFITVNEYLVAKRLISSSLSQALRSRFEAYENVEIDTARIDVLLESKTIGTGSYIVEIKHLPKYKKLATAHDAIEQATRLRDRYDGSVGSRSFAAVILVHEDDNEMDRLNAYLEELAPKPTQSGIDVPLVYTFSTNQLDELSTSDLVEMFPLKARPNRRRRS